MNEKSLVVSAVSGDKEAFAALYMIYKDDLYRYAYFKLGNTEDARDAVSSCIAAAYGSIGSLRLTGAFRSWIFRILYRCCLALVTDQHRMNDRADVSELDRLPAEDDSLSPELKEAFDILDPQDRDIVLLSALGGYNSREISAIMGLKPATVRSRLSRALTKMRQFLE